MRKQLCNVLALLFATLLISSGLAEENSDWFRHSAISPDGKTILFSCKGDIYSVAAEGGKATPLTIHNAWEGHPVWSRDGKQIAFASDRHGNLDVFVMPSGGGKATRLTQHSANDIPSDFSSAGDTVLFKSARTDTAEASLFPTTRLAELYEIKTEGGTPRMITTIPASEARYSEDGKQIVYRDEKAYEIEFRKHDVSAFARDIWLMDIESGEHNQLTDFEGGDHNAVFHGDSIYYLSENGNNNFNVWSMDSKGDNAKQISKFETHPVRHLSVSNDGLLSFTQHGRLFTLDPGQEPQPLEITFHTDTQTSDYEIKNVSSISEFAVSPNGKEIAIVSRGEIFVTSRDFKTTVQITNTATQERSVSFLSLIHI